MAGDQWHGPEFFADKFVVNDSGFTNDLAGGTFFIDRVALKVAFTNNHAPVANVATYSFGKGTVIKPFQIPLNAFLAANTTDADDDARSLIILTSTNATVSTNATHITHQLCQRSAREHPIRCEGCASIARVIRSGWRPTTSPFSGRTVSAPHGDQQWRRGNGPEFTACRVTPTSFNVRPT